MKTIIVATDFSQPSLNAVYYAAEMAAYLHKQLAIIHVCEYPLVATELPYPAYDLAALQDSAQADLKALEEKVRQQMTSKVDLTTVVKTGDVIMQINNFCASQEVYAVVMGIHGTSGKTNRLFFGSKTLEGLNHLDYPLIIVPEDAVFMTIERVAIASDFKNVSKKIHFYDIRQFVKDLHADLHVIHIKEKNKPLREVKDSDEFRIFRDLMRDLNPAYHIVEKTNIADGINELLKTLEIDLLILMPGRHTGLEKLFHKSQSKDLTLHMQVPILSIHE